MSQKNIVDESQEFKPIEGILQAEFYTCTGRNISAIGIHGTSSFTGAQRHMQSKGSENDLYVPFLAGRARIHIPISGKPNNH